MVGTALDIGAQSQQPSGAFAHPTVNGEIAIERHMLIAYERRTIGAETS
jgi:hypothetical protein